MEDQIGDLAKYAELASKRSDGNIPNTNFTLCYNRPLDAFRVLFLLFSLSELISAFILIKLFLAHLTMSCRYSGRSDCGCTYEMTASLLSENHDVIEEFKAEPVTLDPESDDCSWKQVPFNDLLTHHYKTEPLRQARANSGWGLNVGSSAFLTVLLNLKKLYE